MHFCDCILQCVMMPQVYKAKSSASVSFAIYHHSGTDCPKVLKSCTRQDSSAKQSQVQEVEPSVQEKQL
jgi:hypothetical protein